MHPNLKQYAGEGRPEKWTAGLDWFRWRTNDGEDTRPLLHAIWGIQERDVANASIHRPWTFQGFKGHQTDTVRYGQCQGRVLWESSGEKAHSTLGLTELCAGSAKRIDLQITLSLSIPRPTFGSSLLKSITQTSRSRRRTPIRLGLHTETSGLWLGTVGRRTHRSYLRIYDKGIEQRSAARGKLWRIELEAKYSHAAELWRRNQQQLTDPQFCGNYCVSSLKSSGCCWPFGTAVDGDADLTLGRNTQTTPSRLASWICLSVRPVIPRLLTVFTVAELLTMLGLSAVAAPIGNDNAQR